MKKSEKADDPRLSELCKMDEAERILDRSHQVVRDMAKAKIIREYPLAKNFCMYNIADLKKERQRRDGNKAIRDMAKKNKS
ncbi:MAG: hypothetical protein V3R57_09865 [Candidatus Bathyarchaeia archaeon]